LGGTNEKNRSSDSSEETLSRTAPSNSTELAQDSETQNAKQKDSGGCLLIGFVLLVLAIAYNPTLLSILNNCEDLNPYRRDVKVAPLMNLDIPEDFDLSQWTNKEIDFQSYESRNVPTNVKRFSSIASASDVFHYECEEVHSNPHVIYGGQGDNKYCISAVETERADLEGLCAPNGTYNSYVIIQKGNVVIKIYDRSDDKYSTKRDIAIEQLAQEIYQAIGK
jgi:hypothetical protein